MTDKPASKKQFFIVYSPEGLTPPVVAHPSHKGALWQAYQLAAKHPEASFFVMGSMSKPCTAQGIEAQRAATAKQGAVADESPVRESECAQGIPA